MPVNPNLNPPVSSAAVHAAIFQAKAPRRGENPDPERGSERVKCVPARTETQFLGALNRGLELELTREPESGPAGWSRSLSGIGSLEPRINNLRGILGL